MIETVKNAWSIPELRKKLTYTVMIVLIFRIGAAIPVPFIDASVIQAMFAHAAQGNGANPLAFIDMMTGGAFASATLFAMSIAPYITASIVINLLTVAIPALERLAKEGEEGRRRLAVITRYTTLGLAIVQSIAYYVMNRNMGSISHRYGAEGVFAAVVIVMSFAAGAMLIVWLGESIDKKGVGNGISIILFSGIISRAPSAIMLLWGMIQMGQLGATRFYFFAPAVVALFIFLVGAIVLMTNAERRIPVQYAKRVVGRKMYGGQSSYIPIKVTMSGVMPIIFASSLLAMPGMILGFIDPWGNMDTWFANFLRLFTFNTMLYAALYLVLIIAFNYFYVAIQYNPIEMANNMRKNSGTIPGIRPGKPTSDFISRVIGKITLAGALFIAGVGILPIILTNLTAVNIALGGTSIIIVVGVALDTVRQLESQMMMRHYKGFLE